MGGKNISPVPAGFAPRHHPRITAGFHALGGTANPALSVSAVLSDCQRTCMASMEVDPELSDTLMHLSGYIFRAAIDEGLRRK